MKTFTVSTDAVFKVRAVDAAEAAEMIRAIYDMEIVAGQVKLHEVQNTFQVDEDGLPDGETMLHELIYGITPDQS